MTSSMKLVLCGLLLVQLLLLVEVKGQSACQAQATCSSCCPGFCSSSESCSVTWTDSAHTQGYCTCSSSLSTGAIVGIAIGFFVFVVLVILLVCFCFGLCCFQGRGWMYNSQPMYMGPAGTAYGGTAYGPTPGGPVTAMAPQGAYAQPVPAATYDDTTPPPQYSQVAAVPAAAAQQQTVYNYNNTAEGEMAGPPVKPEKI